MTSIKLNHEVMGELERLVKDGNYISTACGAVGITIQTYDNWKRWGREDNNGREFHELYKEFYERLSKAESYAEGEFLGIIKDAAKAGTWQAAAWYLERKYPEKWGRRERFDGNINIKKKTDVEHLTDEELKAIEDIYRKREAAEPGGDTE